MANSNGQNRNKNNQAVSSETEKTEPKKIKVLYQFLGGQWYAFAEGESEVYFWKVPLQTSAKNSIAKNPTKENRKKDGSK